MLQMFVFQPAGHKRHRGRSEDPGEEGKCSGEFAADLLADELV